MGKYWWVTWIKVLALTAVFAVVIVLGYRQVKKSVADYLVDAPADAKLTDKLNLEDMVFDYAGEFVDRMMEESEQIRNAITCANRYEAYGLGRLYRLKGLGKVGALRRLFACVFRVMLCPFVLVAHILYFKMNQLTEGKTVFNSVAGVVGVNVHLNNLFVIHHHYAVTYRLKVSP